MCVCTEVIYLCLSHTHSKHTIADDKADLQDLKERFLKGVYYPLRDLVTADILLCVCV